jgi:hypothetical protein
MGAGSHSISEGKDFRTRFHRRRAFLARRFSIDMLIGFSVCWAIQSTAALGEHDSP